MKHFFKYSLFFCCCFIVLFACKKDEPAEQISPSDIFNLVWNDFDRNYPYFTHKNIDWDSIHMVNASKISDSTTDTGLFNLIGEMTLCLHDIHVNLSSSYGIIHYSKKHNYPENPPANAINYLSDISVNNPQTIFGSIENTNYSYLRIKTLVGNNSSFSKAVNSLDSLKYRDGFIIDIRSNSGGNEYNGKSFARRFVSQETLYKYSRTRDGNNWDDFSVWNASTLLPTDYLNYSKKIILLTNRSVYSSAELFVLMMKTYPNLIIVGDTTGGASANPKKRSLPNGWKYYISTWQSAAPDYKLIEDNGIAPDHYVLMTASSINAGEDLILERALELLDN